MPAEVTENKDVHSKYICFQAPLLNRGTIWLGDNKQAVTAKEGLVLRPGDKMVLDIDSDRLLGMYLKDFVFAGDYGGDKLVVAYLEETNGAN